MYSSSTMDRRYVTNKRMERRTADGELISVTNMKTVHYNAPDGSRREFVDYNYLPPPPPPRRHEHSDKSWFRSHARSSSTSRCPVSRQRHDQAFRRSSIEYIDPPVPVREEMIHIEERKRHQETCQSYNRRSPSPQLRPTPSPRPSVRFELDTLRQQDRHYDDFDRTYSTISSNTSPLHCIIDRINYIRRASGRRELVPCPRLAGKAGSWAEKIVLTGEFRRDINEKMNIWRGRNMQPSIVDAWYDEAVEFDQMNYVTLDWLRTVGVGRAYCARMREHVVVVIYD